MCDVPFAHGKTPPVHAGLGRREFIRIATIGGGAAIVAGISANGAMAGGKAKALLLSCMDYRLVDDLVKMMGTMGMQDNYDHVVLAGASLGVVNDKFAGWHDTFWQHLDVAKQLHGIEEVIVIDHRDCGAYRLALGEAAVSTPEAELQMHTLAINEFALRVAARHPELKVEGWLMALDGTAEHIEIAAAA